MREPFGEDNLWSWRLWELGSCEFDSQDLAWATLGDSTVTWERKKDVVMSVVYLLCWLIGIISFNFLRKVMFISCKHNC